MPETHDIGSFFVHRVSLEPTSPRLHRAPTTEIEEPYRHSNSVVVRLFRRFGLVFGHWQNPDRTEDEALLTALGIKGHGGHDRYDAISLLYPDSETSDEDRQEVEDSDRGVGDAGHARPAVIHF